MTELDQLRMFFWQAVDWARHNNSSELLAFAAEVYGAEKIFVPAAAEPAPASAPVAEPVA